MTEPVMSHALKAASQYPAIAYLAGIMPIWAGGFRKSERGRAPARKQWRAGSCWPSSTPSDCFRHNQRRN